MAGNDEPHLVIRAATRTPLPRSVQAWMMLPAILRGSSPHADNRYGKVFTLRVASMGTMVYLADPADIKTVFAGDPKVFHAGEANAMLRGLLGETSVLVVDEDVHRDRRRRWGPSTGTR